MSRPNKIINMPHALSSHILFIPRKLPKYDSAIPINTKIIENHKIKNKEFIIVSFVMLGDFSEDFISSKDLPVM